LRLSRALRGPHALGKMGTCFLQARDPCGLSESPLTEEPGGEFADPRRWKFDQQVGEIICAVKLIRARSISSVSNARSILVRASNPSEQIVLIAR
jgi:hypothetical protein